MAMPSLPASPRESDPVCLDHEEAEHRLANLLQIVLCNAAQLAPLQDQISAVCLLQNLVTGRSDDERPVAGHLRALAAALDSLLLRPRGHRLTVEVEIAAEELSLPAHALSGLGRLVVEALMNAAKHAFPAGPGGSVAMRLSRTDAGLACVIVDDGVGSRNTSGRIGSRGMILTDALAQRAGGNCGWTFGQHGTEVRITWPVQPNGSSQHAEGKRDV